MSHQPQAGTAPSHTGQKKSRAGKFLIRLTAIATLGGLLFGFDTGVISGALLYMRQDLDLSSVQEALLVTALLFPGATGGALLGGPLSDRIGRKLTLVACAAVFIAGTLGCAFAPDFGTLVFARIVLGAAVGCASVTCPVYLAEMAPADRRGRMVTINQLMIVVGLFLSFSTNVLLDQLIHDPRAWRFMLGIAAVPAAALFLGMFWLPDSPRWYALKGRFEQCRQTLLLGRDAATADHEYGQIVETVKIDAQESRGLGAELRILRAHPWMRRILLIGVVFAIAQQTTGVNVVTYYTPTVLANSGLTNSASLLASVTVGITLIVGTLIGIWLLGFMPRRRMVLIGFGAVAVSHVCLALTFALPESTVRSYLILVFLLCVDSSMTTFLGTSSWLILSEISPTRIRGFAMGASLAALWMANAAISFLFPIVVGAIGPIPTFAIFIVFNVVAFVFCARYIPETKDRTLEEVEEQLRSAEPARSVKQTV